MAGAELGIGLLDAVEGAAGEETGPPRPPAAAAGTGVTASAGDDARPTARAWAGPIASFTLVLPWRRRRAAVAVSAPAPRMRAADGHDAPRPPLSTAPAPSARVSEEPTLVAAVADVGAEDGAGAGRSASTSRGPGIAHCEPPRSSIGSSSPPTASWR